VKLTQLSRGKTALVIQPKERNDESVNCYAMTLCQHVAKKNIKSPVTECSGNVNE